MRRRDPRPTRFRRSGNIGAPQIELPA
jgi:hypothetical protein